MDSIAINKKDLVLLDENIYQVVVTKNTGAEKTGNIDIKSILIFLLAFVILFAFILFRRQRKKVTSISLKNKNGFAPAIFTELEREVLKAISGNSQKGKLTSIDELNKVLGVNKKSIEVQKKQRSDIISSINKKYTFIKKNDSDLIERKQAEFDKRSFEYYIDYNRLNDILPFFEKV